MLVFAQSFTKGPISALNTSFRERTGTNFTPTNRPLLFHSIRNFFSPFQLTNIAKPASIVINYTLGCRNGMRSRRETVYVSFILIPNVCDWRNSYLGINIGLELKVIRPYLEHVEQC